MSATNRHHGATADLVSLEARAAAAGSVWACMFSSADEYEDALIQHRRAEGRYGSGAAWQWRLAVGAGLAVIAAAILMY